MQPVRNRPATLTNSPAAIWKEACSMGRNTLTLRPHLHLPLRRLALCLDCEKCFELGATACPACGSGTWITLARFLEGGAAAEFAEARTPNAA
jgi:hypothetical protein